MPGDPILRSWKEIADFLGCDVKTCARWEAECGLPIRRFDPNSKRSRVFAEKADLQAWLDDRKPAKPPNSPKKAMRGSRSYLIGAAVLLAGVPLAWYGLKPLVFPSSEPVIAVIPLPTQGMSPDAAYQAGQLDQLLRDLLSFGGRAKVFSLAKLPDASSAPALTALLKGLPEPDFLLRAQMTPPQDPRSLSVQLLDVRTRETIWSRVFESASSDLTACLNAIRREVRRCLTLPGDHRPSLSGPSAAELGVGAAFLPALAPLVEESDPWTLHFQAVKYADAADAAANDLAIELFRRILDLDPGFARAYTGLARCYANYVNYQGRKELFWLDKADAFLAEAQKLDPDLVETFVVRIKNRMMRDFLLDADTDEESLRLAGEALKRYPYDGRLCGIVGDLRLKRFDRRGDPSDLDEAMRLLGLSFSADPRSLINMTLAELLMFKGRFGQALAVCAEVEREHPLAIIALRRGEILYYQGDLAAGLDALRSCVSPIHVRIESLQYQAMIAARRGDRSRALSLLREIEILNPRREARYYDHLREASVLAGLGELDRARALLSEGLASLRTFGTYIWRSYVEIDPNFREMRRGLALASPRPAASR